MGFGKLLGNRLASDTGLLRSQPRRIHGFARFVYEPLGHLPLLIQSAQLDVRIFE